MLTPGLAARMARVALGDVTREWPNKIEPCQQPMSVHGGMPVEAPEEIGCTARGPRTSSGPVIT